MDLQEIQSSQGYGNSLVHVLTSLQKWAKDLPAWELIQGMDLLTRPVNQRFTRMQRIAPFIVIEGPDSAGKTFHSEGISLWLTKQGFAVQGLTFPNNQTPLGRFLKRALREQIPLSTWTHHVLFSLHRWEFASWIVDMLSRNYAVIIERYAWSGTAYSWASDPSADPCQYMILDAGLPQPDLVICIETSFSDILSRGGIAPSLFVDIDFQQKLRTCYADPRIWKGINVVVHETQMNHGHHARLWFDGFKGNFFCALNQNLGPISGSRVKFVMRVVWRLIFGNRCFDVSMYKTDSLCLSDGEFSFTEDTDLSGLCIVISSRSSGRRTSCVSSVRGNGRSSR